MGELFVEWVVMLEYIGWVDGVVDQILVVILVMQ